MTKYNCGTLSTEGCSSQGIHSFLDLFASVIDPVLGFSGFSLLDVDWYGAVHLLQSLFYIPIVVYTTTRRIFAYLGYFPVNCIPVVVEVIVNSSTVQCAVHITTRNWHDSHMWGIPSLTRQLIPCKKPRNISTGSRNLACKGITLIPQ